MTRQPAKIVKAIEQLYSNDDIEIFTDYVESDSLLNEIKWSEFEERTADEILQKINERDT